MLGSETNIKNIDETQEVEKKSSELTSDNVVEASKEEQHEQEEGEHNVKSAQDEQNELLNKLFNNVNYAIILAFFDKFSEHLGLKDITNFKNFDSSLINKKTINRKLLDFHINLLKNLHLGKNVKKDKWEHYLVKYVGKYSIEESLHIEQNGYLNCDIDLRLSILKNLLESQFDENLKFKQILTEQINDLNTIRSTSIGRDKDGVLYWYFMDKEFTIRLFTQNANDNDGKTWKLIAKELTELKDLIAKLNEEPSLVKLRSTKRYLANIEKEKKLKEKQAKEAQALKEAAEAEKINKKDEEKEVNIEEKVTKPDDLYDDEEEEEEKEQDSNRKTETDSIASVKSEIKDEDSSSYDLKSKSSKNDEETTDSNDNQIKSEPVKEEIKEETNESFNTKEEVVDEDASLKTPVKEVKIDEILEDDFIQPIALRKSTRASARKAQEIIHQQPLKTPTKSPTKKQTTTTPAKKNKKEDEPDDLDENEDEDEEVNKKTNKRKKNEDDYEFKPKISKTPNKETSNKRSKKKSKKKETDSESEEEEEEEEDSNFDSSCVKCSKVKRNQILILCDGCDAAYHLACLKMQEVPDGDWYCCLCEHDKLIRALEEKSSLIDNHLKEIELAKTKSISKRTNRIADIGANLDNLFSKNSKQKRRTNENNDPNEDDEDDDEEKSMNKKRPRRQPFEDVNHKPASNFFNNVEPVGPRSCRVKSKISYTFEEYDRTMKEAMGAEEEEAVAAPSKPTRTSKRLIKKAKEYEDDDTEYEEDEDDDGDEEKDDKKSNAGDSSSSEFKVKTKKKYFSESEEEEGDEDENDKENSDEDFRPSKSKRKTESRKKRTSSSKSKKKPKSKRNYYEEDDDVDDDIEDDDDEEEEDEYSDYSDNGKDYKRAAKKHKDLYSFERRSTRNRKCLKESYCEIEDDEEDEYKEKKQKKNKKKKFSDDDEFSEDYSDEDNKSKSTRRSSRAKKTNKKYDDDDYDLDDEENEDDYGNENEEKSLDKNHRNSTTKSKSRIKKPWSDDEDEDEEHEENESEEEDIKKKSKSVIKKPWSKEEDESEEEVIKEDEENEEEKEDKKEQEEKPKEEIKKDKEETTSNKNGHKSDLIYSSSSSYSSSASSSRSNSPSNKMLNSKTTNQQLNSETLIEKLNKTTSLINEENKTKENGDDDKHSDLEKDKSPIKKTSEIDIVNKPTLPSLDSSSSTHSLIQQPTITYSSQLTNVQPKQIQLTQPQQPGFQIYSPIDLAQKNPIINSQATINNFVNQNNSNFTNIYSPSYPLYYYYQQQQQQLNSQPVQSLMLQPNQPIQAQMIPGVPTTQPQLTFLQPYATNPIVYNGQAQTPNFVTSPYPIQPVTNLFQPHLIGFNNGPVTNGASLQPNTNGMPVNLTPLNPPSHHHPQVQQ